MASSYIRKKGYKEPPKPDRWGEMGWRERRAWYETYVYKPKDKRIRRSVEGSFTYGLRTIKLLRHKKWDENDMLDWLRRATDKRIVGFSISAVERLNTVVRQMAELREIKVNSVTNGLRKLLRQEARSIRRECVTTVRKIALSHANYPISHGVGEPLESSREYKYLGKARWERDGVIYKKFTFIVEEDSIIKMKAILSMENMSFAEWLKQRVRKYVSMKFRRLGELQTLVDKEIDQSISDAEMEGGEVNAHTKSESKRKEDQEIEKNLSQPETQSKQEDKKDPQG